MKTRYGKARTQPDLVRLAEQLPPPLAARAAHALRIVGDLRRLSLCDHTLGGSSEPQRAATLRTGMYLCALHPRAGVKCAACAERHLARRPHPCAGCGAGGASTEHFPEVVLDAETTDASGTRSPLLLHWVTLVGLRGCATCCRSALTIAEKHVLPPDARGRGRSTQPSLHPDAEEAARAADAGGTG